MRALVILPAYNEAENVLPLSEEILAKDASIDVLVVDDNSPDGTGDLVRGAQSEEPRLHLLHRPDKLGLGTAYLAGFRYALDHGYDYIFTMDCDRSHNPRYIPQMLEAMIDHDLVIGSRYVPGGGRATHRSTAQRPAHRRRGRSSRHGRRPATADRTPRRTARRR